MTGPDNANAVVNVDGIPENEPGACVTVNIDYPCAMVTLGLGPINHKSSANTFITH